jgi:hypothetical protein
MGAILKKLEAQLRKMKSGVVGASDELQAQAKTLDDEYEKLYKRSADALSRAKAAVAAVDSRDWETSAPHMQALGGAAKDLTAAFTQMKSLEKKKEVIWKAIASLAG